jgi:hypothetical protein
LEDDGGAFRQRCYLTSHDEVRGADPSADDGTDSCSYAAAE